MKGLAQRIKARLDALGLAEREASRRAGFGVSYVGDIIHGRSKEPATPRLMKLAQVLECDLDYLIGRQATARRVSGESRSFGAETENSVSTQRLIDLFSSSSLSDDLWVRMSAGAVDKVPVIPPLTHVQNAYAWSISTPHMEPRYFVGETIYLHPGVIPRIGDFVLVKLKSGNVTIARLAETGPEVRLSFLAGGEAKVAMEDIEFIHRVVGSAG